MRRGRGKRKKADRGKGRPKSFGRGGGTNKGTVHKTSLNDEEENLTVVLASL